MEKSNINKAFIRNKEEFSTYKTLAETMFNMDKNFPEQVFNTSYKGYLFAEFDWAINAELWDVIRCLSIETKDDFIILAVTNPDPEEYYFKEFGYYNWLEIPVKLSEDDYYKIMQTGPEGYEADALHYNSFDLVWFSPTGKWAIWGERDFGVCVIAFNDQDTEKKLVPCVQSWRRIDSDVSSWIELNYRDKKMFESDMRILRKNYSK